MGKQVEKLAKKFHEVYQQEAKRHKDVRYPDDYEKLSEDIKDFDRALALWVIVNLKDIVEIDEEKDREIIGEFRAELKLHFCKYIYQTDKSKWLHPDNTCIPMVIERNIEKMHKAITKENPVRLKEK